MHTLFIVPTCMILDQASAKIKAFVSTFSLIKKASAKIKDHQSLTSPMQCSQKFIFYHCHHQSIDSHSNHKEILFNIYISQCQPPSFTDFYSQ